MLHSYEYHKFLGNLIFEAIKIFCYFGRTNWIYAFFASKINRKEKV